ncbi:MAG: DUF2336 domain-containing protein [Bauldia sp.]
MPTGRDSSLVNFKALEQDASPERRGELLRNVVALLTLVSDRCADGLLASYDSVMVRLSDMVDEAVRAEVARALAEMKRAPGAIVRKLARDEIEVAQPLLVRSAALSEEDLVGIISICGQPHRRAIAVRPAIGEGVTGALLERGDDSVRRLAAGNVTAKFGDTGYQRLLRQAETDAEMQDLIAAHPSTPHSVLTRLCEVARDEVRAAIRDRVMAKVGEAPAASARDWRETAERLFSGYDFEQANERMRRRHAAGTLNMAFVGELAAANEFAQAAVALGILSGFGLSEVLNWFSNREVDLVSIVARALGGTSLDFARLLKAGPWLFRLGAEERARATERFHALDVATAREELARRRQAGRAA